MLILVFSIRKMSFSSFITFAALSIFLIPNVSAFSCKINGHNVECDSFDKDWCCDDYCCDFDEYTKRNPGPPTGMIVAFVIISVILIVICCCRRIARQKYRERALYGLETDAIIAVPNANYPRQVHALPVTNPYSPNPSVPYQPLQPAPYPPQQPLPYDPPPPYEDAPPYPVGQTPYPAGQPLYHAGQQYRSVDRKI